MASRDRVDNVLYCLLTCPRIGDTPALHRTRISNREGRMLRSVFAKAIVAASLVGVLFPATALAQSAITGLVKDSSGGVLPGVAVEASSPALIEKSRTVVSDAQGRYTVVDLRPGVYKVTFTIQGFGTFIQDRIELPSNFTATVNAELRVGAVEESVTVSGAAPVVDVSHAQDRKSVV